MKRQKKASEILQSGTPVFGRTVGFNNIFPDIGTFEIEITELENAFHSTTGDFAVFNQNNPPGEYFDCHNRSCRGGGVSITEVVRKMVSSRETICDVELQCRGYENAHRACYHHFRVRVALQYKAAIKDN